MNKQIALSDWIIIDGYCATRVLKGTDFNEVKNRIAFIEKGGRVRISDFTDEDTDNKNWKSVCRGSGGDNPKENGYYGFDEETRQEVDTKLKEMGYSF